MRRPLLFILLWADLLCPPAAAAAEEIPSCFTLIRVDAGGGMTVIERMKGFGLSVERPLGAAARPYASLAPFVWESDLEVVSATADGRPVIPAIHVNKKNGSRCIKLAAQDTGLSGHEYTVTYRAKDRILFTGDADRLDWEIWGSREDTTPLRLFCAIALPEGAVISRQRARLGYETSGFKPVTQWINKDGVAFFRAEEPMTDTESFVVSVEWNRGVVAPDGSEKRLFAAQACQWGLFALLFLLCAALWFRFGRDPRPDVSIPLFYPPAGPGGSPLSPAAVSYIRSAARLTSRGFAALLLNLAAQKLLAMTGTGTRRDPYILQTDEESLFRAAQKSVSSPASQGGRAAKSSREKRGTWLKALQKGEGFDRAERLSLFELFPDMPPQPLSIRGRHSWEVAEARSAAYTALSDRYRDTWQLNGRMVWLMFFVCYGGIILLQGTLWALFGGDIAVTLAMICTAAFLTAVICRAAKFMIRIWLRWQEMGVRSMVLFAAYVLLVPVILTYDVILDDTRKDFFLYGFMQSWMEIRITVWLGLMAYLLSLTRSAAEVFLTPLKVLGFLLLFLLAAGMTAYGNGFMGSASLAFAGSLLLPLIFMPLMKRPAPGTEKILAEIEGLALYLGAAEAQRLNFLNPPDRSPEEFHRLMPYAVALGLEKAWGARFADTLAAMRFRGNSLQMLAEYEHRMQGS